MRYGLLALSIAMLASGGVAAQSALAISHSAPVAATEGLRNAGEPGGSYGSVPFTGARAHTLRLAVR